MNTRRITLMALVAGVMVLLAALLSGVIPSGSSQARPPCDSLPTVAQVQRSIRQHHDLVTAIEANGSGVRVTATEPCGSLDRGIVTITYNSRLEAEGITHILNTHSGFQAPVQLHRS